MTRQISMLVTYILCTRKTVNHITQCNNIFVYFQCSMFLMQVRNPDYSGVIGFAIPSRFENKITKYVFEVSNTSLL